MSLVIALWADIYIAYIALHSIFTFLRQLYPGDFTNFAGSTNIFLFNAALMIWWFDQIVALLRWTWLLLLQRYFFIDNRTWWYLLSSSSPYPHLFRPFLVVKNLWVSRSVRHLRFLGKLFLGVSSNFFHYSMGNSYCKEDDSKGEEVK